MAEKLEQKFELDAPIEVVWTFLTDPYQIVGCLPGAAITKTVDARTYEGAITVKVGLITASYAGKVIFERVDPARHETEIVGVGQDQKGKGSAEMKMVSRLRAVGDAKTEVLVNSEFQITGILAQIGRGIIENVADLMLRQFTAQFKVKLDLTRMKYSKVVKAHAEVFVKFYGQRLAEVQSLSGVKISPDGTNNASSPGDVGKYLEAVKQIAGEMVYNSAKIILKGAAQKENVPLTEL